MNYRILLSLLIIPSLLSENKTIEVRKIINSDDFAQEKNSYCKNRSDPSILTWFEDFNGDSLSKENWQYSVSNGFNYNGQYISGWGNGELQYYTKPQRNTRFNEHHHIDDVSGENLILKEKIENEKIKNVTNNLFIEDGYLKIQPIYNKKKPYFGFNYTSARINTKSLKSFTYPSKITICFKVPKGIGFWPAFWLMPDKDVQWPQGGEIDIIEHRGRISNIASSTLHFGKTPTNKSTLVGEALIPRKVRFIDKFHSITLKWLEDEISFYLDNESEPYFRIDSNHPEFKKFSYPFNSTYYMIINVAVGGIYDDYWVDYDAFCKNRLCTNKENPDQQRFIVDWIEYELLGE